MKAVFNSQQFHCIPLQMDALQRFCMLQNTEEISGCVQAPVVRKPISANPRLNRPNPRNRFIPRLNYVPRSSISIIQGLKLRVKLNTPSEVDYKQLLDEVFVISRIIKVEVRVISRSRRLRLITLTETLIILDITKTESNNCFIIH